MKDKNLEKIKVIQLEIMDYIDKICKKYDIKYCIFWGSLLGAIRHKGFIPWDDDIDIAMLPDDYKKFMEVMENENSDKYYLQNIYNTKYYIFPFSKVRKYHTTRIDEESNYLPFKKGINIDVFPLFKYPTSKFKQFLFKYRLQVINVLLTRDYKQEKSKKKYINVFLHLVPRSLTNKVLIRKMNKLLNYNGEFNEYRVTYKKGFDKNCFDVITVPFEDRKYTAPAGYDKILTELYGDYMTPPPKKDRHGHGAESKNIILSFDKEYDEL